MSQNYFHCFRSGDRVDLTNINPDNIHIEDIAYGLSNIFRFNGQMPEGVRYSVARHSLLVCQYLDSEDPKLQLTALMHDSTEYLLSDIPRPTKLQIPGIKLFEDKLYTIIAKKFNLYDPLPKRVHEADMNAFTWEIKNLKHLGGVWEYDEQDFIRQFDILYRRINSTAGISIT